MPIKSLFSWLFRIGDKRDKRIDSFLDSYRMRYKGGGVKLEILIPAGICFLKNNFEIETALNKIEMLGHGHPLRRNKDRVENVGYRKFFLHVSKSGRELNSNTFDELLQELESRK